MDAMRHTSEAVVPVGMSRREVLRTGGALALSVVARPVVAAVAPGAVSLPVRPAHPVAIAGVPSSASAATLRAAVRDAALAATDFSWLRRGDRVLLKVACNSPNPYPATTHPEAIVAMTDLLRQRGAVVYAGDQSGVQFVHHTRDSQRGSTRANFRQNGIERAMLASAARLAAFEEAGYDAYFAAEPPAGSHFRRELWLPNLVREVEHIIYLPRVSKHVLAGATLGLKAAVGWLREDSRLELHRDGATFLEKCADINGCKEIRDRLRLVLSVGTQVQTSFGPDSGYVATPDVGLVIASENLIDHDLASCAYLLHVSREATPWRPRLFDPYPQLSSLMNRTFVAYIWGAEQFTRVQSYDAAPLSSPWASGVLRRGCEIFGRPERVQLVNVNESAPAMILQAITTDTIYPA